MRPSNLARLLAGGHHRDQRESPEVGLLRFRADTDRNLAVGTGRIAAHIAGGLLSGMSHAAAWQDTDFHMQEVPVVAGNAAGNSAGNLAGHEDLADMSDIPGYSLVVDCRTRMTGCGHSGNSSTDLHSVGSVEVAHSYSCCYRRSNRLMTY